MTTRGSKGTFPGMPKENQYTAVQTSAGAQLADSTTRTAILHASGLLALPAGFWELGRVVRLEASGDMSCVVTTPGNLTLDVDFLNPTPAHVIAATTPTLGLNVVAKTNRAWRFVMDMVCTTKAAGAAATKVTHQSLFTSECVVGSAVPTVGGNGSLLSPVTTPVEGTGFDGDVAQTLNLFATFSVSTTGTNITCKMARWRTEGP